MVQLLTPARIGRLFSVHRSTVSRWISEGKVFEPSEIIYINERPRVSITEINRVIKSGRGKIR